MPNCLQNASPRHLGRLVVLCLLLLSCPTLRSKDVPAKAETSAPALPASPSDTIGRLTPRGTVLGLISAARKGNTGLAALYLNTPLRGAEAEALASQLAAVIDRRLPARLNEISDNPEGSGRDPLNPDEDLIGVIQTAAGSRDIVVERVDRGKAGKVWLFSRKTLAWIPEAFQELSESALERFLPDFMIRTRIADIPLFEWVAVFVGMPLVYLLTGVLNRILSLAVGIVLRDRDEIPLGQILGYSGLHFACSFLHSLSDGWPRRFLSPSWLGNSGLPQH